MIVMGLFAWYAMQPAKRDPFNGDLVLKYSWPLRIIAWCGLAFLSVAFIAGLAAPPPRAKLAGLIIVETINALITGSLAFLTLHFTWDRVLLNDEGITRHSAARLPLTITW